MAWFGLIGGPLLLFGNLGVVFDWWDQSGAVNILVVPEFIWGHSSASTARSGDSGGTRQSSRVPYAMLP
jgi:hypothetical protein